jgi:5'-nucleotidase/UDP-sugar diphosphatase
MFSFKKRPFAVALAALSLVGLAACGSSGGSATTTQASGQPMTLTVLHVNDHHSRLDAETASFSLMTASGARRAVNVERGGFTRVAALMESLSAGKDNVLKLHAGDAITGDLYYTLDNGKSDAAMMNAVCFDAFIPGNHEFDMGDSNLKTFLDFLRAGTCKTEVLSANIKPQLGVSALAKTTATDYLKPSAVMTRQGQKIGIVGLTVSLKTKTSSRPDATTEFLGEVSAAQAEIDKLKAAGVNKIILMTHQGYDIDKDMAARISGVDVIVGGDSHTLLGDAGLANFGLTPSGAYPTVVSNKDGKQVCVVQAWQYSHALGELNVSFDASGDVTQCAGTAYVTIGENFKAASGAALTADDLSAIRADIASQSSLRIVTPSVTAAAVLKPFSDAKTAFGSNKVAMATEELCLRRVPGTKLDSSRSSLGDLCNKASRVIAHGGDIQQLVAQAFLEQGKTFGKADFSLLNGGGVRTDIRPADVTVSTIYTLLPFKNTLVRLNLSGQEVVNALEDAIDNVVVNKSTGAYPYSAGLRWTADLTKAKGQRVSNVDVLLADGSYTAIGLATTYTAIVIDYIADGGDLYTTLKNVTAGRRENTYLDYADAFMNYARKNPTLARLPVAQYSTQGFVDLP